MKFSRPIIITIIAVGALIAGGAPLLVRQQAKTSQTLAVADSAWPRIASQAMFFDNQMFVQGLASAETISQQKSIKAIVVPQHLLAAPLIAEQIKRASGREIDTVFIIGPNHFNVGSAAIASALAVWQTPLGEVTSDPVLGAQFLTDLQLVSGPDVFTNEHAVGAIVPFVKYYLPSARIVPIVFRSDADQADVEQVSHWLAKNLPKKSLVIFSIDFSHYLPREQADKMDTQTRDYIDNKNLSKIMTLGNDNLDSPASLATALELAQLKKWQTYIVANKNSDDFTLTKASQTTSYFAINFTD